MGRSHLQIAKAIECGSAEAAERLMRNHLENGKIAPIGILSQWDDSAKSAQTKRRPAT